MGPLVGHALVGPPWALVGRALVGPRGPSSAGPLWATLGPRGQALLGCPWASDAILREKAGQLLLTYFL